MSPSHHHHDGTAEVVHVDSQQFRRMSLNNADMDQILVDSAKATEAEHNMSFFQSLKLYPKAVGFSVLLSAAIIMEGFDIVLINNLFAVPAFKEKFGVLLPDGTYELTAAWQSGLANGAYVGEITGLMINGWIADRYGYKKTMIGALAAVNFLIFIVFFVQNIVQLLCGLILMGIPWGIFQTLTTTYAAEVCPAPSLSRSCNNTNSMLPGMPCLPESLSHHVRQPLLGHRSIPGLCCPQGCRRSQRSVGV